MKKFLSVAVCALCALTVSAQRASSSSSSFFSSEKADQGVTFGIRGGLNFAGLSGDVDDELGGRTSFHVGVIADIPIVQSFYIQPGVFLSSKGAKYDWSDDGESYSETYNPLYIEIPILASYRYNFSDADQLQVNFGPYFAFGVSGKCKCEYEYDGDTEKEEYDYFGDDGFKRFDCGLQVGAGIILARHYYVGLSYEFGLTKINDWDGGDGVKNHNFMISIGYNF